LVLLSSCSVFESKLIGSTHKTHISSFDTAVSFTKSVIEESEIEKKVFSRESDSLLFFEDLIENESFLLVTLLGMDKKKIISDSLKSLGLEYDSVQIVSNEAQSTATFYSNKKVHYLISKKLIIKKTIKSG